MSPPNNEGRTLTERDLEALGTALKEAIGCSTCVFSTEQTDTLKSVADNVDQTQKVATRMIIYGFVASIFGGIVFAMKHIIIEIMTTGKIPGK